MNIKKLPFLYKCSIFSLFFTISWILLSLPLAATAPVIYQHAGSGDQKRVALTFDDGPHPKYTAEILEILAEFGVEATFFVVGINAETYPELVKLEIAEGHEVGNHSYHHYRMTNLDGTVFEKDVIKGEEALEKILGKRSVLFRPPEGICTEKTKELCEREGYSIILWSVDTRDWAHTPVEEICKNIKKNTKDGSIILMHDYISKNSPTPAVLRRIIPMLQEEGFEFVTVSELLAN